MLNHMTESSKNSFFREWGVLIGFGVVAVAAIVGFRIWTDHKANEPVTAAYRHYVTQVASQSKAGTEFLETYFKKYSRRTVASKHYESVCGSVTVFADESGANPEAVSAQMARACRMFAKHGVNAEIP